MSTSLRIIRQNGNVPKSLPGEDHITGLVIYMAAADIPESFKAERVQPLSTIDAAEAPVSWTIPRQQTARRQQPRGPCACSTII